MSWSLAFFTPWPPQRSGIAGRSAELLPLLAARGHAIDVFVDEREVAAAGRAPDRAPAPGEIRVQSAHDFVWRQARGQYDLPVYQLGNSRLHAFIWPYLFRGPGLVVLHDGRLHHARARALLLQRRHGDYRSELAWNHPDLSPDAAELAIRGFDGPYYYQWPMRRAVVASARLVGTHSRAVEAELRSAHPDAAVEYIPLGEGRAQRGDEAARLQARTALGYGVDDVVVGLFGGLSREKRVPQVMRAFAAALARTAAARLLLAGPRDPQVDVEALARELGIEPVTRVLDSPSDDLFDNAIDAVDVSVHLRWPSAGETSGPWLRALAAGRATILTDLEQLAAIPTLDPRTWRTHGPDGPATGHTTDSVAVAIDIVDEDHSLRLALQRLIVDGALRERLGAAARAYWEREHTVDRMLIGFERAIVRTLSQPVPQPTLPPHLRPDPLRHTRAVGRQVGLADSGIL